MKCKLHIVFVAIMIMFFGMVSCEKEEKKPEALALEMVVQDASEYNAKDGSISLNITRGEPPYFFYWNTGDSVEAISGLGAGDYWVRIVYGSDGKSFFEQTATVEQPDPEPLQIEFNVTHVAQYDKPQGVVEVVVSGGEPPYSFQWAHGPNTAVVEELFAGIYSVTVTDAGAPFSITTSASVAVTQPAFVCEQDSIRDIDGNRYSTVLINDVCWMGENLKAIHLPEPHEGELMPVDGRFCRGLFCQGVQGAHYTWHGLMAGAEPASSPEDKIQGICPTGWYIPTRQTFEDLDQYLSVDGNGGPGFFSGAKMKGENSSSGFDALFTGSWGFGVYSQAPYAAFWTSSVPDNQPNNARMVYVTEDTPFLNAANQPRGFGFNVRCVKDEDIP